MDKFTDHRFIGFTLMRFGHTWFKFRFIKHMISDQRYFFSETFIR